MGNGIGGIRAIRRRLLRGLLAATGDPRFQVELAGGEAVGAPREEALATLRIRDQGALFRLVIDPELQLGELHTQGRLNLEGDAPSLLEALGSPAPDWIARAPTERSPSIPRSAFCACFGAASQRGGRTSRVAIAPSSCSPKPAGP